MREIRPCLRKAFKKGSLAYQLEVKFMQTGLVAPPRARRALGSAHKPSPAMRPDATGM